MKKTTSLLAKWVHKLPWSCSSSSAWAAPSVAGAGSPLLPSAADGRCFTAALQSGVLGTCTLCHRHDGSSSLSSRFCLINAGVLYLYFSSFQQIDEEEYGGTWELTKEGFMTSFALFLVTPLAFFKLVSELCLWGKRPGGKAGEVVHW